MGFWINPFDFKNLDHPFPTIMLMINPVGVGMIIIMGHFYNLRYINDNRSFKKKDIVGWPLLWLFLCWSCLSFLVWVGGHFEEYVLWAFFIVFWVPSVYWLVFRSRRFYNELQYAAL